MRLLVLAAIGLFSLLMLAPLSARADCVWTPIGWVPPGCERRHDEWREQERREEWREHERREQERLRREQEDLDHWRHRPGGS